MMYETLGAEPFSWSGSTYQDIKNVGRRDDSVLVVPIGSIEQHGHHLPVATDTILVDAVVSRTGEHLTENDDNIPFLVTPTIWTGYSPHHMDFGGTLTAPFETVLAVLVDVIESGLENGFDSALIVNGHGGNTSLIAAATSEVGSAAADRQILSCTYFELAAPFIDEVRDSDIGGIAHGGEFETSLMLHLRPDLVQKDRTNVTYREEPYTHAGKEMFDPGTLSPYRSFAEMSETGELGDPTSASAAKGEELLANLVAELGTIIREVSRN
jgi:creatinine amidohydrolase